MTLLILVRYSTACTRGAHLSLGGALLTPPDRRRNFVAAHQIAVEGRWDVADAVSVRTRPSSSRCAALAQTH
jgi:hypothetical protein